jgi:hypothetical protein
MRKNNRRLFERREDNCNEKASLTASTYFQNPFKINLTIVELKSSMTIDAVVTTRCDTNKSSLFNIQLQFLFKC